MRASAWDCSGHCCFMLSFPAEKAVFRIKGKSSHAEKHPDARTSPQLVRLAEEQTCEARGPMATSAIPGATVRSIRPYKSSEQYLYAMKEDLAEWLKELYALDIEVGTFVEVLETGAVLCSHANNVTHVAGEFARACPGLARRLRLPAAGVTYNDAAQPGTFQARDNVSNFIQWCRKEMDIKEVLMFETEDLVLRKNEKNFVLCLLELARRASRFGMSAPTLVQMEEEIEEELREELDLLLGEAPPPRPPRRPQDLQNLDQMVQRLVSRCTCPVQFAMIKVSEGKYRVGDSNTLIFVRILRSHIMVRVGGGWDTLEHYLDKHDPCRCTSLSHKQALKTGSAQWQVQHEIRLCPAVTAAGSSQPQPTLVVSRSQSPLPPVAWGTYVPPSRTTGRKPCSSPSPEGSGRPPGASPRREPSEPQRVPPGRTREPPATPAEKQLPAGRETRRAPTPSRPAPGKREGAGGAEGPCGRRVAGTPGKSPQEPTAPRALATPPPKSSRQGGKPVPRPRERGLSPAGGVAPTAGRAPSPTADRPPSPRRDAPRPAPSRKSPLPGCRGRGRSPSPLQRAGRPARADGSAPPPGGAGGTAACRPPTPPAHSRAGAAQGPRRGCPAPSGTRGAQRDPGDPTPAVGAGPNGGGRAPRGRSARPARGSAARPLRPARPRGLCRSLEEEEEEILAGISGLGAAAEQNHRPQGNRRPEEDGAAEAPAGGEVRPGGSPRPACPAAAAAPDGAAVWPRRYASVLEELCRGRQPLQPVELSSWIAQIPPRAGGAGATPAALGARGKARSGEAAAAAAAPPRSPRPAPAKPRRCLKKPDRVPSIYKLKLRPKARPRRDHRPGKRPSRIPRPLGRPAGGRGQPRAPAPPRPAQPGGRPAAKPPPAASAGRLAEDDEEAWV